MLAHDAVSQDTKQELCDLRERVDPVALLHAIREAQPALAAIGQPVHVRQRLHRRIGRRRGAGHFPLKVDNLGALHRHERHLAESGQYLAAKRDAGLHGRPGLHAHGDMFFEIARRQIGNGRAADRPDGQRQGHGLFARLDARNNQCRTPPRLLGTDHAMTADRDPLRLVRLIRSLRAPGLGDIDLAAGRIPTSARWVRI